MHTIIQPHLQAQKILSPLENDLISISIIIFMDMFYYLLPYVFLNSSLTLLKVKLPFLSWFLVCPSIIFLLMDWQNRMTTISTERLHIWSGLYMVCGCLLYLASIFKSKSQAEQSNALRLSIIFIPIMSLIYLKDFLFVNGVTLAEKEIIFEQNTNWKMNSNYIDLWLITLLLYYGIRYGILGIKLKFEKHRLDASMTSITLGTSIINHSIKNEIQKVEYMLERAKHHIDLENKEASLQSVDKIGSITSHLQHMVDRMKEKTQEVTLSEQTVVLCDLTDKVLSGFQPILEKKGIILIKDYQFLGSLQCDPHHLYEVLSNLCSNAIESIQGETGCITIRIKHLKRKLVFEIQDTGCGIEKNSFSKIFEPFFTTKKKPKNYGLGLTYCFNVMNKHQGRIMVVESKRNIGTTIALLFPRKRVIDVNQKLKGRSSYAKDSGLTSRR
ncbi:sensor histidine kinase [Neobacillus sp. Marseille-QA0830]